MSGCRIRLLPSLAKRRRRKEKDSLDCKFSETQNIQVLRDLFMCTGIAGASVNLELFNFTSGVRSSLLL